MAYKFRCIFRANQNVREEQEILEKEKTGQVEDNRDCHYRRSRATSLDKKGSYVVKTNRSDQERKKR